MIVRLAWDTVAGTLVPLDAITVGGTTAPPVTTPPVTVPPVTTPPANSPDPNPIPATTGIVKVMGNKLVDETGNAWVGHGVNICDVRGDESATGLSYTVSAAEIIRRLDYAKTLGVDYIRYLLESYTTAQQLTNDAAYLAAVKSVVQHALGIGMKVEVGIWLDPSESPPLGGQCTAATIPIVQLIAAAFANNQDVLIGLCNEPRNNATEALKQAYRTAAVNCVAAIRATEQAIGAKTHVVLVGGADSWARNVSWFVANPIADTQVAYACHVYDPAASWQSEFQTAAKTLPIVIEEYGPASMTQDDCVALQTYCHTNAIPSAAWCFHQASPPNMLNNTASQNNGTQVGMPLSLTAWGQAWASNRKTLK